MLTGRCLVLSAVSNGPIGSCAREVLPFQTDRASRTRVVCMTVDLWPKNCGQMKVHNGVIVVM